MKKKLEPYMKQVRDTIGTASNRLMVDDYKELLDELADEIAARREALTADEAARRRAEED
jgi:hypothetical protein